MRLILLASAASLLGGGAFAQSLLGQSQPGQGSSLPAVVVPAPPPVVAAPSAPVPAPAPAAPAPPPGLVETPLPPPDSGAGATPSGVDTDNGGGGDQPTQVQAVSPSAPVVPAPAGNGGASPPSGGTAATQPQDVPPVQANDWVQGKTAVLGVLNKVDGSTSTLTIPVGGQATAGDLTISVQACVSRPPGQLPDSAIFLTLQSKSQQDGGSIYRGWMVRSAPGATDVGNAGEAFRVITCS